MGGSLIQQSSRGIMDDEEEEELGSCSSFGNDDSSSSKGSSSMDFMDDATSSSSSSSSSSLDRTEEEGPLYEMSSLIAQLPFKSGLSKHFEGKSQSFASLSSVRCLEDLAKPDRKKKLIKSSKSYAGGLDGHRSLSPNGCSKMITKKPSRGSFSSLGGKRQQSFLAGRPPVAPQRSASQTLLFA